MTGEEKTAFLGELLLSVNNRLYVTCCDNTFLLQETSYSQPEIMDLLIQNNDIREVCGQMFSMDHKPVILTDNLSMIYGTVTDTNGAYYLIGPAFVSDDMRDIAEKKIYDLHLNKEMNTEILRFIHKIPILDITRLMEYVVMLEKAVNDNSITISDIRYTGAASQSNKNPLQEEAAYHGTYEEEQIMLRMVREGDIHNFEKQMNVMVNTGTPGILADNKARQWKNLVLVNVVLFSRAAIEGGLSSETALSLTDYYFQAVEACQDLSALTNITKTMQKDFVTRVHTCRTNKSYSKPVQGCIQYIERHLEEPVVLKEMAGSLGYTDYYLSRRFKAETGMSVSSFIKERRLERAKFMLKTSKMPIHEISDRLQFNSQSYFTAQFRKKYGIQPTEYRSKNQII